ncbi:MAG: polysaccharide pyruvyl transferase family protein [Haloechinothrix sp.]
MTPHRPIRGQKRRAGGGPRVGFFGNLGSGNLGNDGSLDAVVAFLREWHPDAKLGFLCMGPEQVTARYGAPATHLQWYEPHAGTATGARAVMLKVVGKVLDPFRTLAWVCRYDVVIVPGMGVLEATVPLRPWAFPYSLLSLCVSGRLVGSRVALVSVGSDVIRKRVTRWVITRAARLAHYRSYRDVLSRDAMREMGVDVVADEVYPDLAFALQVPPATPAVTGAVGVGVMAYYGGNDDRGRAGEIHRAYLDTMKRFVRWLVDGGRQVRLFTGDQMDDNVLTEILADLRAHRPALDPSLVVAEPAATLQDLMQQMATVHTVVATRFHNVLCALKLSKPTLSIGYAAKNDVLMAGMGLGEFCQFARSVDLDRLIEQFTALESRSEQLRRTMAERNLAVARRLDHQFTALSVALFPVAEQVPHTAEPVPAQKGV